jgi:hypothetical protein
MSEISGRQRLEISRICSVILSGKDGDDALPYQEKQTRNAVREVSK